MDNHFEWSSEIQISEGSPAREESGSFSFVAFPYQKPKRSTDESQMLSCAHFEDFEQQEIDEGPTRVMIREMSPKKNDLKELSPKRHLKLSYEPEVVRIEMMN